MAEYIWNCVGMTVPDAWEPAAIERDGLVFQCCDLPICELKWNVVRGTFSFEKHLKRLTKGNKGARLSGVDESETPPVWAESIARLAESGIRAKSFIWQAESNRGIGAALHNPATGMAALVQFFIYTEQDEARAAEALATFRDYAGGKTVPWAMFGLRARVPSQFRLHTFSFKPGRYTVRYWRPKSGKHADRLPPGKGPGTHLVFERFAPASVLLKNVSMADWLRSNLEDAPPSSVDMIEHPDCVRWNGAAKSSLLRTVLKRTVHTQGKAWLADPGNSILCVAANGTVPLQETVFNDMCESYELV